MPSLLNVVSQALAYIYVENTFCRTKKARTTLRIRRPPSLRNCLENKCLICFLGRMIQMCQAERSVGTETILLPAVRRYTWGDPLPRCSSAV